ERGDRSVVPTLKKLAETAPDPRTRLHALWTLDGLDSLEPANVINALDDKSRDVRVNAVRMSERFLADGNAQVQAAVLKRVDDQDWAVRQQLAPSLGALPSGAREAAVTTLLDRHGDDPVVVDGALSGLRGGEAIVLSNLVETRTPSPARDAAITMVSATLVRGAQEASVQSVLQRAGDTTRPEWQRSALLRGAEVALLGATAPGNAPGRGRGGLGAGRGGDPTAPGGRAGPGGAPAFPREGGAGRAANTDEPGAAAAPGRGRGGRGGGATVLKLNREPVSLSELAGAGGDLGTRAAALLARIEWPGKPGASAPVAPLTPAEQERFEARHTVYQSICLPCHQEDGRGKEMI